MKLVKIFLATSIIHTKKTLPENLYGIITTGRRF